MPLVNRTFSQLIDFTRTTSATYVNSAGLIATTPASVNLLTYTQEFDNAAWTKTNTTVTANAATAPDGTATADKLAETATTAVHNTGQSITTTVQAYSFSCYVKAAERNFALLYHTQSNASVSVNLTTGATGTASGTVAPTSSSVTSVGNGWWRVAMTVTATAASNFFGVYVMNDLVNASYAGTAGAGIYVWGAQLEVGSTATDYTRNYGGLYPPRFDYDPVTLAPKGFLIEEQRTNLLLRSEQFDNGSWNKVGATITADATTSPDGTADADALVEDATTGTHYTQQFYTGFTSGTAYTISVYVKAGTRTWVEMDLPSAAFGVAQGGFFNLSGSGSLGNATGSPTSRTITALGNGWYRITVTATATATAGGNCLLLAASANGTTSYTGTNGAQALFLYGAQLEAGAFGSFVTSYIPTVASQVTRTADVASIAAPNFASWYNQSAGTLVVSASQPTIFAASRTASALSYPGSGSRVGIYRQAAGSINGFVTPGAGALSSGVNAVANTAWKGAIAYDATTANVSVNGSAVVAGANSASLGLFDNLGIGGYASGNENFCGHIRSIRYYPTRLTDAQLQALTA